MGQETRTWRQDTCAIKNALRVDSLSIRDSMDATLVLDKHCLKKSRFLQFYRTVAAEFNSRCHDMENAVVWANQSCVSYNKRSPIGSPSFDAVQALSCELLKAQFHILEPDVAFFTVGAKRDRYIKEIFACETVDVITPRRLWHFKIGATHCFRVNHPAWHGSRPFLEKAIDMAKNLA